MVPLLVIIFQAMSNLDRIDLLHFFINPISKLKRKDVEVSDILTVLSCYHDTNLFPYLKVQLIEQVQSNNLENIEDVLWGREKY